MQLKNLLQFKATMKVENSVVPETESLKDEDSPRIKRQGLKRESKAFDLQCRYILAKSKTDMITFSP